MLGDHTDHPARDSVRDILGGLAVGGAWTAVLALVVLAAGWAIYRGLPALTTWLAGL